MHIFYLNTDLLVFSTCLRPRFAFRCSRLAKVLRALIHLPQKLDLQIPDLKATLASNIKQIRRGLDSITAMAESKLVCYARLQGGTGDLRKSSTNGWIS